MSTSEQKFEKHFREGMKNKDFDSFKKRYPTLLSCIVKSLDEQHPPTGLEKTNPDLFKFFRSGNVIAFQIEPMCHEKDIEDTDNPGKTKKVRECMPHTDTPEPLAAMFDQLRDQLFRHGFEVKIFGPPSAMLRSLKKSDGIEVNKQIELMKSIGLIADQVKYFEKTFAENDLRRSERAAKDITMLIETIKKVFGGADQ